VIRFFIPPLKERKEDIPLLVNHMLEKFRKEGESRQKIHQSALHRLIGYSFPGNIRELENIIERACIFAEGKNIKEKDLKFDSKLENCEKGVNISPEQFRWALENCQWNKTKAAVKIGISRRQFYRLLRKYQISKRSS
jgi:DNA-binding NtrC family response regulator